MTADLTQAVWRKSTFSNGSGGDCVEVARNLPGIVAVRDSKDPHGPALIFTPGEWRTFAAGVKSGGFDLT
ncbi:MAG TPA: DUF397 domain-containing protein [Streptosporangiaceae bacterium]